MGRRWAREKTFQLLYQLGMREDGQAEQISNYINALGESSEVIVDPPKSLLPEDLAYIRAVAEGVLAEQEALDEKIQSLLKSWVLDRLPKVDRALLRLGAYEIQHVADVPKSVSINEIVVLAKNYAAEDAHAYINGVLAHFEKITVEAEKVIGRDAEETNQVPGESEVQQDG